MSDSHIKLARGTPRIQYAADGAQTAFTYPFAIFAAEDLQVLLNGAPQGSGFAIDGAGESAGGTVTFDTPPTGGTLVTLERRLPIERITDFQEGGDFAARSLNNELDYLTACIQQVEGDRARALSYAASDYPASSQLPDRGQRAGRVLGFDATGNPAMLDPADLGGGTGAAGGDFTASGTGAITRTLALKASDLISIRDFGAVGDGVTDDTLAVQSALAAHDAVLVPAGTHVISATIVLGEGKTLIGLGQASILRAHTTGFDLIELPAGYASLAGLRLEGGACGVRLRGRLGPCVQNALTDLTIRNSTDGIVLDGSTDPAKPCYWNNFARVLVLGHARHGIHLTRSGAGDTPNANRFSQCRVYAQSSGATGNGLYVEAGRFNNSFTDFEVNLGPEAAACIRIGAETDKNLLVNCYTEASGGVSNIVLEAGSTETAIINLLTASDGAAIEDHSGGQYTAYNAGYPDKNRMGKTRLTDVTAELLRFDTEYREFAGSDGFDIDLTSSFYLVSAFNGEVTATLPTADQANGASITIKKTDASANHVVISELAGPGPDGREVRLGARYDYATMVSNGAGWWLSAHNRMAENADFYDSAGLFVPDLTRRLYLVDAYSGDIEVRLPDPSSSHAVGRLVTIKRNDNSGHSLTVTKEGGGGPDNQTISLTGKGHALTVMSNGAGWQVISLHS